MSTDPTAIRLDVAENLLTIDWSDGHVSTYDGAYLRWVCPCAKCRGHAPGEVEPPAWDDVKEVRARGASGVGTYALGLEFTDGHDSGIYSFDWLREVCPADEDGLDERGRPV